MQADPEVAGKLSSAAGRHGRLEAQHPLFVGDRVDTDIAGAVNAGL
jgi:ribonucleotide monophosphatase NagD (HAD superfamily)